MILTLGSVSSLSIFPKTWYLCSATPLFYLALDPEGGRVYLPASNTCNSLPEFNQGMGQFLKKISRNCWLEPKQETRCFEWSLVLVSPIVFLQYQQPQVLHFVNLRDHKLILSVNSISLPSFDAPIVVFWLTTSKNLPYYTCLASHTKNHPILGKSSNQTIFYKAVWYMGLFWNLSTSSPCVPQKESDF